MIPLKDEPKTDSISKTGMWIADRLRERFGADVSVAVRKVADRYPLFPVEEQLVARAVASRRAEFATGRWCARLALEAVGCAPCPIPMGPLRAPQWPHGFIGSITHSAGLAVAVAATRDTFKSIGIDLCEVSATSSVLSLASPFVSDEVEVENARALSTFGVDPGVLLFSAKESTVKVVSAQMGRFLEFTEIRVTLDPGGFVASLPGLAGEVQGWWESQNGLLLTGAFARP
jgi:4'-phosphopantetheinyl transferase EntD